MGLTYQGFCYMETMQHCDLLNFDVNTMVELSVYRPYPRFMDI